MDIWLIYRIIRNQDAKIERIASVEYCTNEADARKYSRLFDLQIPNDLRNKISHKYYLTSLVDK